MIDHLGRYVQRGYCLAKNKEQIEKEGKLCDNCDSYGGPYGICDLTGEEHDEGDVCKHWMNSSLSSLSKLNIDKI